MVNHTTPHAAGTRRMPQKTRVCAIFWPKHLRITKWWSCFSIEKLPDVIGFFVFVLVLPNDALFTQAMGLLIVCEERCFSKQQVLGEVRRAPPIEDTCHG